MPSGRAAHKMLGRVGLGEMTFENSSACTLYLAAMRPCMTAFPQTVSYEPVCSGLSSKPQPGLRRDRARPVTHLEVKHRAAAVVADGTDSLSCGDVLPDSDVDLVQVAAHRVVVVSVVENDDT